MHGAIIGDIVGSPFEFKRMKRKDFQWFASGCGITDDTVCTVAVADSVLNDKDIIASLREWALRDFKLSGGYGKQFIQWLAQDNPKPYTSYGNGAAMRISPVAWLSKTEEGMLAEAERITAISHNHPEGIKGARATALAIWMARHGSTVGAIRKRLEMEFGYDLSRTVDGIRPDYERSEASQTSVPESIICALESECFEDAITNAVSLGGDADTMACIAGSIAEARFGVPDALVHKAITYLPREMLKVVEQFYQSLALD
ncbi:ADP-ribosylglycohydrolase family protein [Candidatus Moduliflexota bacterium]